ncbi:MAG: hypothetical protein BGN82_10585 [Alphaproteobacteria bacterium 65-7]|nr:MAG: hypothetical protein BGN82_10585 [Alphaproteobacteria bacterium 65-7]
MTAAQHPTPGPKLPEHHSTDRPRPTTDDKIDAQMEDTFPASDPPSFSGGNHTIGAPKGRESEAPAPDSPAVKDAEKKVKDGKTRDVEKY